MRRWLRDDDELSQYGGELMELDERVDEAVSGGSSSLLLLGRPRWLVSMTPGGAVLGVDAARGAGDGPPFKL